MRGTLWQPPNMRGKKTYSFRCGCCEARDLRQIEMDRIALLEIAEAISPQESEFCIKRPNPAKQEALL